jgi:asparagine N-glycosylation enzyme membrane subunit Stt3
MKFFKIFIVLFILVNLYLCAYPVLHGDIGYNTDVGRDFLILQDIVSTHKLPLIGPHSGLEGLFHGPLWPYINLPVFVLSNGNPIAVGWFWVFLVSCSVFATYIVGKKVFNEYVGLFSALIVSLISVGYSDSLLNPFGAVIFSPLFFYFFYKYVKTMKVMYLILAVFTIGILIQFEIVFGGPILILSLIFLLIFLFKKRKLRHLLSIFVLVIPLSTYIIFELRHNFLQLRSIISHAGTQTGSGKMVLTGVLQNRIDGFLNTLAAVPNLPILLTLFVVLLFVYVGFKSLKDKKLKNREFYLLFIYFYLGYWPLTFYLTGQVMGYHVLPFVPVAFIILSSAYLLIRKEIFLIIFLFVLFFGSIAAKNKLDAFSSLTGSGTGSWKFSHQLAQTLFKSAPSEFGYYTFTADEFGYGPRYAMVFTNKEYSNVSALANTKKRVTYVIMAPTENGANNNREWWIKNKVRINNTPEQIINYPNGFEVEKFVLTNEEIRIPSDPNLLNGLFFR